MSVTCKALSISICESLKLTNMSGSLGGGFIPSNRPSKACKATNNRQTMQGNKLSANARLHYALNVD